MDTARLLLWLVALGALVVLTGRAMTTVQKQVWRQA